MLHIANDNATITEVPPIGTAAGFEPLRARASVSRLPTASCGALHPPAAHCCDGGRGVARPWRRRCILQQAFALHACGLARDPARSPRAAFAEVAQVALSGWGTLPRP